MSLLNDKVGVQLKMYEASGINVSRWCIVLVNCIHVNLSSVSFYKPAVVFKTAGYRAEI